MCSEQAYIKCYKNMKEKKGEREIERERDSIKGDRDKSKQEKQESRWILGGNRFFISKLGWSQDTFWEWNTDPQ